MPQRTVIQIKQCIKWNAYCLDNFGGMMKKNVFVIFHQQYIIQNEHGLLHLKKKLKKKMEIYL